MAPEHTAVAAEVRRVDVKRGAGPGGGGVREPGL